MTVCIAAACEAQGEPKIVVCADNLVSGALGSAETMFKVRIFKGWTILTAGETSDIKAFVSKMSGKLHDARIAKA